MDKVYVKKEEEFEFLYAKDAITMEGLLESEADKFVDFVRNNGGVKNERVYIISGKDMNKFYSLTGDNAYADDLTIVCISFEDIENVSGLVLARFTVGARWFSDVVDNNARREAECDESYEDEDDYYDEDDDYEDDEDYEDE